MTEAAYTSAADLHHVKTSIGRALVVACQIKSDLSSTTARVNTSYKVRRVQTTIFEGEADLFVVAHI